MFSMNIITLFQNNKKKCFFFLFVVIFIFACHLITKYVIKKEESNEKELESDEEELERDDEKEERDEEELESNDEKKESDIKYYESISNQLEAKKCNGKDCLNSSGRNTQILKKCENKQIECVDTNNRCKILDNDPNFTTYCPFQCIETECPNIYKNVLKTKGNTVKK